MPETSQGDGNAAASEAAQTATPQQPPVETGATQLVEIENIGDQGDRIARVDHGFIVIIPDTEPSERVRVEITDVCECVGFAAVTERLDYSE